jgi:hypothetical protein
MSARQFEMQDSTWLNPAFFHFKTVQSIGACFDD